MGLNTVGLHRNGFSEDEVRHIADIYRILYMSDLNVTNAVKLIEEKIPASEIRNEIVQFVLHSDRGIIRSVI